MASLVTRVYSAPVIDYQSGVRCDRSLLAPVVNDPFMGYTGGEIDSTPAKEMIAVMRTYARQYNDSVYFMLDSIGGDSDKSASELCKVGRFPQEQCIFMEKVHCNSGRPKSCLAVKIIGAFQYLRDVVLSDCKYFMRVDSDEYIYLPAIEKWLEGLPFFEHEKVVVGGFRGKRWRSLSVLFPGGSVLFSRPMIENFFGGRQWVAANRSLVQANINPTDDDVFVGYTLGYCDWKTEVKYLVSKGDIIMGGPHGMSTNIKRWRNVEDGRHCVWKIHKIDIEDYDEVHRYYRNHAVRYNSSLTSPTVCDKSTSQDMFVYKLKNRLCPDLLLAVDCNEYATKDPPTLRASNCTS